MTQVAAHPRNLAAPDLLRKGFLRESLEKVRGLTMVHESALVDLAHQLDLIVAESIPGAIVECGVWCGGASFFMADVLRRSGITDRKVWLFDSFEGMPPPQEIDGPAAQEWAKTPNKPWYSTKVPFSLEGVMENAAKLGLADQTEFVKGWFDGTLPASRDRIGPVALLRIDCDWYASVKCCLDNLYDLVAPGGFVVLDDYYTYDGCVLAVHEFLSRRGLAHRIESVVSDWSGTELHHAARFRKGSANWRLAHQKLRLEIDLAQHISSDQRFTLIDEEQLRADLAAAERAVPFPQCDGVYAGQPLDDQAAIDELERLRAAGIAFAVIAWPAMWWLDYYKRFAEHLRSKYRCVLQNGRVVIFDLSKMPAAGEEAANA